MRSARPTRSLAATFAVLLAALALVPGLSTAPAAHADDRQLLGAQEAEPYVFILLDVSGSMNQSVPCTQAQFDAGECTMVCPPGPCLPRLIADDPASKLFVAKQAIYEIMREVDDINFGFATFDHDAARLVRKHFWYRLARNQPNGFITLKSGTVFPQPGQEFIFGETWDCTRSAPNNESLRYIGCNADNPARLDDAWALQRAQRLPKLDEDGDTNVEIFIQDPADGEVYRVEFEAINTDVGPNVLTPNLDVDRCRNSSCSSREFIADKPMTFERVDEMAYWEPGEGVRRLPPACTNPASPFFGTCPDTAYFSFWGSGEGPNAPRQIRAGGDRGWDPNTDTSADDYNGYNLRKVTQADPEGRGGDFSIGDVIPFDWLNDQRERIAYRMAPNLLTVPTEDVFNPTSIQPDFRIATYFRDQRVGGDDFHRLKPQFEAVDAKPLVARSGTPTGAAMQDFRNWFQSWRTTAGGSNGDPNFECRQPYLIVLTDGLASFSDGLTACDEAEILRRDLGLRSFAVAFGLEESTFSGFTNTLTCIADNGGTGSVDHDGDGEPDGPGPLFPQNKDQLVAALTEIFGEIREEARSFASAAVPTVQASVEDKIYLTSFLPLNGTSVWSGQVDSYLKPLPLDADGLPDRDERCSGTNDSGCLVWAAGEKLYEQRAQNLADSPPDYNIGTGVLERRVFYGRETVGDPIPMERHPFVPPAPPTAMGVPGAAWLDLLAGLEIPFTDPDALDKAEDVVTFLHEPKQAVRPDPADPTAEITIDYQLGDIFHSNPVVLGGPENFTYFLNDLNGYQSFALTNRVRRKVVFVGANDGQLHAFDAGTYSATVVDEPDLVCPDAEADGRTPRIIESEQFTNGTGHELFSYVPRAAMPSLREQALTTDHQYTVDAPVVPADVFVDPAFTPSLGPTEADREWRTIVMGGLRRGGSGYYALDVTTPDKITTEPICLLDGVEQANTPTSITTQSNSYVPFCNGLSGTLPSDCGPLPYPAVRWEFSDPTDEDANGLPDLGDTWSTPTVTRIRVCDGTNCDPSATGNDIEDRYVAIFGGGFGQIGDEAYPFDGPAPGNHLYIIDVETAEILYKRKLDDGMIPSDPAVIDVNLDGYADRIYIGTTAGLLYKVNMASEIPQIDPVIGRITTSAWDPYAIFDTDGRPFFYPPSAIFVTAIDQFAIAFGVGDRDDLWSDQPQEGRFYTLVDADFARGDSDLPYDETDLESIQVNDPQTTTNLLTDPPSGLQGGWVLELAPQERLITRPFAVSGVLFFTVYTPEVEFIGSGGNEEVVCARTGQSRIFVTFSTNANAVFDDSGLLSRYTAVDEFVTDPFSELSTTKNQPIDPNDPNAPSDPSDPGYSDKACRDLEPLTQSLRELFPEDCRFTNSTYNIQTIRSDRGLVCIAPVPICIIEKNWTEL